jgi:hypothetical protein
MYHAREPEFHRAFSYVGRGSMRRAHIFPTGVCKMRAVADELKGFSYEDRMPLGEAAKRLQRLQSVVDATSTPE